MIYGFESRSSWETAYGQQQGNAPGDLIVALRDFARQKPEVAALWCFGIGFLLGWKMKPW